MRSNKDFNLPNILTVSRILAVPACAYVLFIDHGTNFTWRIVAWWMFFFVVMTDLLDGRLARARNEVTPLGTLLDPIADKAIVGTAFVGVSILGYLPWWVTIIILTREVGITVLRFAVIKRGVIPASKGGKLKSTMQAFGVGFYILPLADYLYIPRDIFMAVAVILTIITGADYIKKALFTKKDFT